MLRKIKYALFVLFVLCLIAVFYLTSVGLPAALVRKIEPSLQFRGMVLDLERIKLSIFEGIVAANVRYYKKGDVGEPVIQADKFVLKLAPLAWVRGKSVVSGAIIKNGRGRFSAGGDGAGTIAFDDIYADVLFDRGLRLKILSFATTYSGIKLSGKGVIVLPAEKKVLSESSVSSPESLPEADAVRLDMENISAWIKDFAVGNVVNVDLDFFIDPERKEKMTVKASIHGRNTAYGGALIGAWNADISINGKSARANIGLKHALIEGLLLQSVNGLVQFDEKGVITASLKSMVGEETQAGPLALQLNYNLFSDHFEGQATSGCDLRAFEPLLRSFKLKLADIFADFDFKRSMPSGDIRFKGGLKPDFSGRISGEVLADTVSFKRVSAQLVKLGFDAELSEAGEKVTIRPLLVVRDEGHVRGQFVYDSDGKTITFSGMSMADPKAVATMIDPLVASVLEPYSFEGPCYITAFGTLGTTNSAQNDMEINFNAGNVQWKKFRLAPCALTLNVREQNCQIDDFNAGIYRGVIGGLASVDPAAGSTNMIFTLSAQVRNVDFGTLVHSLMGREHESAYEGTCSGAFFLQGLVKDPAGLSVKGKGWLKIEHGRIFTVPIFSGLFDILGKIIPGIETFHGRNNAQATITVENGKVSGRDVYIDGDIFGLKGSGDVYFDGRLDFKMQVTFMRHNSLIGHLVQIATLPLTKALEFRLSGTVSDPKWEAVYLPF